ncbi:MAG: hypothetical protein Q9186_001436 [Xanthomendoza sp. 1 TL-2023]
MPSPPTSSPPLLAQPNTAPTIHTYHCLCSTHLLTTPYRLSTLHQRAAPSLDHARILPLLLPRSSTNHAPHLEEDQNPEAVKEKEAAQRDILPSLLSPNLKATRKPIVVQREDGWEKRRMWRCMRCGVGVGYEILGDGEEAVEKVTGVGKVLFLLEGGLAETGKWNG